MALSLRSWNACSSSNPQWNCVSFRVRFVWGLAMSLYPWMNFRQKFMYPRNDGSSVTFLGSGQSLMAWTRVSCILIHPGPMVHPRKSFCCLWLLLLFCFFFFFVVVV